MSWDRVLISGLLVTLAGCQAPEEAGENSEESKSVTAPIENNESGAERTVRETSEVGLFRWSSGMQMGTFWAAVGNKNGDYLRFYSDDGNDWEPAIELASVDGLAPEGTINIAVGSNALVFPYQLVEGQPEILFLGMDGANSKVRLVELLMKADSPVCAEFPEANRRTCFSITGIDDAFS